MPISDVRKTMDRFPRSISTRLLAGLAVVLWACGGCRAGDMEASGESIAFTVDTVAGVEVVSNLGDGIWRRGEEWSVHLDLRIGAVNGSDEETFTGKFTSASLGPQGQITVLDHLAMDVTIFDRFGRFLRRFGGPGDGPGELRHPSAMAWDPSGRLWVANGHNGRYTVFDSLGTPLKTMVRRIRGLGRRQHQLVFLDGPSVFLDEGAAGRRLAYFRVDTAGTWVDTLASLPYPDRPNFPVPRDFNRDWLNYLPKLIWTLAPDGTVWTTESDSYRLVQRTLKGDTLRVVEAFHRIEEIPDGTRMRLERDLRGVGVDLDRYTIRRPLIRSLHALEDGHLLVQVEEQVGKDSSVMDVFDPKGVFLGTMDLGFPINSRGIPEIRGDTVVATTLGILDVPFVVRGTLQRPQVQ